MKYAIAGVAAVLLIGGAFFMYVQQRPPSVQDVSDGGYWEALIAQKGGMEAYRVFADAAYREPAHRQHDLAHVFGAALYTVEGMEGVRVCDAQFSFGCYHEVTGRAITEHGLGAIDTIHRACAAAQKDNVLACQHGLGHGILAHGGYERVALDASLETCSTLEGAPLVGGCYGGVFMEYNLRTMLGSAAEPRAPDADAYSPCMAVPLDARRACFYYLPQWWHSMLGDNATEARYHISGTRCAALSDAPLRRSCFAGIGSMVVVDAHTPEQGAQLCAAAASLPADRLECVSTAASSIAVDRSRTEGDALCRTLAPDQFEYCSTYMEKQSMQVQGIDVPRVVAP